MSLIENIKKQLALILIGLKRYPCAYACFIAMSLVWESQHVQYNIEDRLLLSLFYGAVVSVTLTLLFERTKMRSLIRTIICSILTIALTWLVYYYLDDSRLTFRILTFILGSLIFYAALSLRLLCMEKNKDTIYASLVTSLTYSFATTIILFLGISICLWAIYELIYDFDNWVWFRTFSICGLCIFPINFISRIPKDDEEFIRNKVYTGFFIFVIIPSLILLSILLLYICKVLTTQTLPSGRLNLFASITILVYLFIYAALKGTPAKPIEFILHKCWIFISIVTLVQIYAIYVRVNAYGLTPLRIISIVLLAIGIYGMYLAARRKPLTSIWTVITCCIIIFAFSPLNIFDLAQFNQTYRLKHLLTKNSILNGNTVNLEMIEKLSDKEKRKISETYHYLSHENSCFLYDHYKALQEIIAPNNDNSFYNALNKRTDNIEQIPEPIIDPFRKLNFDLSNNPINIEGYKSIQRFNGNKLFFKFFKNTYTLTLSDKINNQSVRKDITQHIDNVYKSMLENKNLEKDEYGKYGTHTMRSDEVLWELTDNMTLLITRLTILDKEYIEKNNVTNADALSWNHLEIEGYILYR